MKRIFLFSLLLVAVLGTATARTYRVGEIPNVQLRDARRYVSNPDGILSAEAVRRIDSICGSLRGRGLAQVAVVAVDDIAGGDPFSFAIELFRSWGRGLGAEQQRPGRAAGEGSARDPFRYGRGPRRHPSRRAVQTDPDAADAALLPRRGTTAREWLRASKPRPRCSRGANRICPRSSVPFLAWWEILLIFGVIFVALPVGLRLIALYARPRCPNCGKRRMKPVSQAVVSVTPEYRIEEREYLCPHCGKRYRRRSRSPRNDHFGGSGRRDDHRRRGSRRFRRGRLDRWRFWRRFVSAEAERARGGDPGEAGGESRRGRRKTRRFNKEK